METSHLPGLRPTSEGAEALVTYFQETTVAGLQRFAANHTGKRNRKDWFDQYLDAHDEFRRTGQGLHLRAGITSITRGQRTRNGMHVSDYVPGLFAELDHPDVEAATVEVFGLYSSMQSISVTFTRWDTEVRVKEEALTHDDIGPVPAVQDIEQVLLSKLDSWVDASPAPATPAPFRVFIGHGGDGQWRDLKDSLRDQHNFEVDAFEAMTRASQVISQIVQGMAEGSTAAVLVFTKADEMKDGTWRARQNVVHEAGYFQGRLGWERTILVVEEGVALPSNFDGTQHIGFPSGMISAAEGRVAAALQALRNRPYGICP